MNNQFFGDERDFYKYALLRRLSDGGKLAISVCWLLESAGTGGGGSRFYLEMDTYEKKDPVLFGFLRHYVRKDNTPTVEDLKTKWRGEEIICGAEFFSDEFSLNETERAAYLARFGRNYCKSDLLFLDPSVGIRPKKISTKNSENEYIRLDEIEQLWCGCEKSSLMVFQYYRLHFWSKQTYSLHSQKMERLEKIRQRTGGTLVCVYRCPVAYYFLIRKRHAELIGKIEKAADCLEFDIYRGR